MYMVMVAAALAVGSGDGRDGATDGRTVEKVPPYTLLRVGMEEEEVKKLLGIAERVFNGRDGGGALISLDFYHVGPDWPGTHKWVKVWSKDYRLTEFKIEPCDRPPTKKR